MFLIYFLIIQLWQVVAPLTTVKNQSSEIEKVAWSKFQGSTWQSQHLRTKPSLVVRLAEGLFYKESTRKPTKPSRYPAIARSAKRSPPWRRIVLLQEKKLFLHFSEVLDSPLPFSLSALQKDRLDGRLGIPYRSVAGSIFYDTNQVQAWLNGIPVVVPARSQQAKPASGRRGKPTKKETVEASRRGITVPQLRAQSGGSAC